MPRDVVQQLLLVAVGWFFNGNIESGQMSDEDVFSIGYFGG